MTYKKILFTISLLSLWTLFSAHGVFAITPPSFPSCTNPQGTTIASYDNGVHGIPGNPAEFRGNDKVYQVTDNTLIQCLCTDNGDGTQTNWWKFSSMNEAEITQLKNLGWIFIPTGAAWGLEDTPYMAFNTTFSCKPSAPAATPTPGPSAGGEAGGQRGGEVLGASIGPFGEVLGLATTGNITILYGLLGIGLASLLVGFVLRKNK